MRFVSPMCGTDLRRADGVLLVREPSSSVEVCACEQRVTEPEGPKTGLASVGATFAKIVDSIREEMPEGPANWSFAALALSSVSAVFILDSEAAARPLPFWLTIALISFAIAANATAMRWRREDAEVAKAARLGFDITINDAYLPILRLLTEMALQTREKRQETRSVIIGNLCSAIPVLVPGVPRLRTAVYTFVGVQGPRARALKVAYFTGREDKPRPIHDRDRGRGERIFKWMDKREAVYVDNTEGSEEEGRAYRTYIAVPLQRNATHLGMLTIDAPNKDDLSEANLSAVILAGALLSVAFALAGPPPPLDE
jgi:hypothetical protein